MSKDSIKEQLSPPWKQCIKFCARRWLQEAASGCSPSPHSPPSGQAGCISGDYKMKCLVTGKQP